MLPVQDIIESTRVAIEADGDWALQYGATAGAPELIGELLRKLERDQGIQAEPDNLLITNGASQGLALIVEMLVDPGDPIIAEAPTWMGAVANFRSAGADVHEVPIGDQGLELDALRQTLEALREQGRRAKFLYTIPTFQNPTGVTMPLEQRKTLLEIAEEFDLPIIEDDAYFDLRYQGEPLPTLHSLDTSDRVIYLGTFSKIMAAGMRLGWVIAPEEVISRLMALKADGGTSPFASHAATQFAASGTLVEHIGELRKLYQTRRDAMLAALEKSMPPGTTWTQPEGGFFVWVSFPEQIDVSQLAERCQAEGIEFCPGSIFYSHGDGTDQMRLSYSFANEKQIEQGITTIGKIAKDLLAQPLQTERAE